MEFYSSAPRGKGSVRLRSSRPANSSRGGNRGILGGGQQRAELQTRTAGPRAPVQTGSRKWRSRSCQLSPLVEERRQHLCDFERELPVYRLRASGYLSGQPSPQEAWNQSHSTRTKPGEGSRQGYGVWDSEGRSRSCQVGFAQRRLVPQNAGLDEWASVPASFEKLCHLVWIDNNATFCRCSTNR